MERAKNQLQVVVSCKSEGRGRRFVIGGSKEQEKHVLRSLQRTRYSFQSEDPFFVFGQTIHLNKEKRKAKRAGKGPGSPKALKSSWSPLESSSLPIS
ncbi:hypothetical protein DS67_07810 [Mesotoga sp. SC_4PWA21]|nr:hypothetical protein DS67_07810 [Mesotoga sp. SC_4PWA21]